MSIFRWLRERTRRAFLAGIGDALGDLEGQAWSAEEQPLVEGIRERIKAMLPPATEPAANGTEEPAARPAKRRAR